MPGPQDGGPLSRVLAGRGPEGDEVNNVQFFSISISILIV